MTTITNRPLKIQNFRDLDIWKLGKDIVNNIYGLTDDYPSKETFTLSSQMRRCAISIPSNIAEGFNRCHNKEYKQFLYIALGSCAELETQIELSHDLKYINHDQYKTLLEKLDHESRMIRNLIKRL